MTRSFLVGTGIAIVLIAAAPRAAASDQPGLGNSVFPPVLSVMGVNGAGVPDPAAAYEILVRDLANNPVVNSVVWVDLANCTDMRISHQSSGLVNPALGGQVLDCPTRSVRGVSSVTGRVVLSVLGAGINASGPPAPGPGERCARIYADGVLLGFATVHLYDQNGGAGMPAADGVEISDLSRWLEDFGSGIYVGRSDYGPGSEGVVSIDDLSFWLRQFGLGHSAGGTLGAGFCP
jgi:hypothetical protein